MLPKVSVAVITYNQRDLLAECLESVLAQDYPDFEVVVADDGSTDGTPEMLRGYERRHPGRFRLRLAATNQGITANCNAALQACTGTYVAWLGGDDLMLPGKLAQQVRFLEDHPGHSMCYHDSEIFDSETGRVLQRRNSGPGSRRPRAGGAGSIVEFNSIGASTAMTRRSMHPPGGYDPRVRIASDWLFWIECAAQGPVGFLSECLGKYRKHPGQVTRKMEFLEDEMVTLGLVEARYPWLRKAARRRRARVFVEQGLRALHRGQGREGLAGVWRAFRVDWLAATKMGWAFRRFLVLSRRR